MALWNDDALRPLCDDPTTLLRQLASPRPRFGPGEMTRAPIGVFDSGVGGLSVLRHIHRMLPDESLIYVADSAFAPYGSRSGDEIRERSHLISQFLVDQGARALVVACNTATAEAVSSLRSTLTVPIVAMEPAIKPAAALTRTGVIGVLATERTLASEQIQRLVQRHAQGACVRLQPCPGLVEQVECGELGSDRTRSMVNGYLQPLIDDGIDVLVLGCTHYPFLLPILRELAGDAITIIDPAVAVTQELKRRLVAGAEDEQMLETEASTARFYTTGRVSRVRPVLEALWGVPAAIAGCLDAPTEVGSA